MRIGIMSMQRIINYGSFLQAYGLKKTIEALGHSVEFVDYRVDPPICTKEDVSQKNLYSSKIINAVKILFSKKYREYRELELRQNKSYSEFYSLFKTEWLPILEVTKEVNLTPKLDTLVIGSDEVFNCTQTNENVGYSLQLFGKDNNANRLITYAASFGSTTIEKLEKYGKSDEISFLLNQFDAVSTRDYNSHKIVEALSKIKPVDNVDPVIISDYHDEVPANVDLNNYIIVYAYSGRINSEEAKKIQEFAHKNGRKTLSIGVMQPFTDEYINADPFTMLAYIKNADYVVTDTFHGTVFSIKYQVPFATIIRDSNKEKLSDLLIKFDLENRQVKNIDNLETIIKQPFDNEKIKKLIEQYRLQAMEYLKNNL